MEEFAGETARLAAIRIQIARIMLPEEKAISSQPSAIS